MIYLVTVFGSAALMKFSETCRSKKTAFFLKWAAILIPSILAGLRAQSVGTDVGVYGKAFYEQAVESKSLAAYFSYRDSVLFSDSGYFLLTYLCARLIPDYHFGLFIYMLLFQFFITEASERFGKIYGIESWFLTFLVNLSLYNSALNLLRQSIAMACLFYAGSFIPENRTAKFLVFWLLAVSFHSSALIGIILPVLYLLLHQQKSDNQASVILRMMLILTTGIVFILLSGYLLEFMASTGLVRENYASYLQNGIFNQTSGWISPFEILPDLIFLTVAFLNYPRLAARKLDPSFFILCGILLLFSDFLPLFARYSERIGLYFIPWQCVLTDMELKCFHRSSRIYWYLFASMIFLMVWLRTIFLLNYGETLPYRFFWS